jgi:hypothetical protein
VRETLKVAILVFFAVLVPITVWNAGQLYLTQSCDPKFGCLGTFKLLTYIISFCAIISSISISVAHYLFVARPRKICTIRNMAFLLVGCFVISFSSAFAIFLAERMGTLALIVTWALSSFLVGVVAFKFSN